MNMLYSVKRGGMHSTWCSTYWLLPLSKSVTQMYDYLRSTLVIPCIGQKGFWGGLEAVQVGKSDIG